MPLQKAPETAGSPLIDPSANKYDYLLVFSKIRKDKLITVDPKTGIKTVKDPELGGIVEEDEAGVGGVSSAICGCCDSMPTIGEGIPDDRRVYWSQVPFGDGESINASEKWWRAVPGEKDAKDRGVEELRQAWMDHFKTDTVDPVRHSHRTIARLSRQPHQLCKPHRTHAPPTPPPRPAQPHAQPLTNPTPPKPHTTNPSPPHPHRHPGRELLVRPLFGDHS